MDGEALPGIGAAQQAAGKTAEGLALDALRQRWGQWYRIGHDDARGWWARRRDGLGGDITADTPDELQAAIGEDYALKAVPSEVAGYRPTGVTRR